MRLRGGKVWGEERKSRKGGGEGWEEKCNIRRKGWKGERRMHVRDEKGMEKHETNAKGERESQHERNRHGAKKTEGRREHQNKVESKQHSQTKGKAS